MLLNFWCVEDENNFWRVLKQTLKSCTRSVHCLIKEFVMPIIILSNVFLFSVDLCLALYSIHCLYIYSNHKLIAILVNMIVIPSD